MQTIKGNISALAKQGIREEWRKTKELGPGEDEGLRARLRQGVMRKLAKLKPGGTTQIRAIRGVQGNVETAPEGMAKALADHWRPTFESKAIDKDDLSSWIQELRHQGKLPSICPKRGDHVKWRIQEADIR